MSHQFFRFQQTLIDEDPMLDIKFRFFERAKQIWRNLPLRFEVTKYFYNYLEDNFELLRPCQTTCTLFNHPSDLRFEKI